MSWYLAHCDEVKFLSEEKLCHFAIAIRSCNDTGFHTPWVWANTTPLSIYSVTLPSEYRAFPSKRRLGIGINKRLFSSAWKRKKNTQYNTMRVFRLIALWGRFHPQNCKMGWGGWGREERAGGGGGNFTRDPCLKSGLKPHLYGKK